MKNLQKILNKILEDCDPDIGEILNTKDDEGYPYWEQLYDPCDIALRWQQLRNDNGYKKSNEQKEIRKGEII